MRTIVVLALVLGCIGVVHAGSTTTTTRDPDVRIVTGYKKGRKLRVKLVTVGWVDLELRTARSFEAMRRAAAADGIELVARSGFRSHEQQTWLYEQWKAGLGNRAARPGRSNHQNGRAVDLVIEAPETYAWLLDNARAFGFEKTVRDEPWHWEHSPRKRRASRAERTATR